MITDKDRKEFRHMLVLIPLTAIVMVAFFAVVAGFMERVGA